MSEEAYDSLTHIAAQGISKSLNRNDLTNDELAQMLKQGVVAQKSLRHQCKDVNYPKGGYIYIMGLSSEIVGANAGPVWFKLGGTVLDPLHRSFDIDKSQVVFPGSLTVYAWSAEVSDWREAELALQAPFSKRHPLGRDYFQVRWEDALAHAKLVGRQFAKKSLRATTARDRLASL